MDWTPRSVSPVRNCSNASTRKGFENTSFFGRKPWEGRMPLDNDDKWNLTRNRLMHLVKLESIVFAWSESERLADTLSEWMERTLDLAANRP